MTWPSAGYRFFTCDNCAYTWRSPCRDHLSPSGEDCAACGEFIHPVESREAPLPVDEFGNLTGEPETPREFPEQAVRVESGPIQFGDDWPGLFLRGKHCAWAWGNLKMALELLDKIPLPPETSVFMKPALLGLLRDLQSPLVKPKRPPT